MKKCKYIAVLMAAAMLFSGCGLIVIPSKGVLSANGEGTEASIDEESEISFGQFYHEETPAVSEESVFDETAEETTLSEKTTAVPVTTTTAAPVTTTTAAPVTTTTAAPVTTTTAAPVTTTTAAPATTTTAAPVTTTTAAPVTTTTAAPVTTTASAEPQSLVLSQSGREKMLRLVNEARAEHGLDPLVLEDNADSFARTRAKELYTSYSHTRPNGMGLMESYNAMDIYYGMFGENIAYGMNTMSTVEEAFEAWMNSDGHRANILNENYTSLGVGMYAVKVKGNWYYYWCQEFAVYY